MNQVETMKTTGIIERLKAAKSYQEALTIANEAKGYQWASPKTKRRWAKLLELKLRGQ